MQIQKMHSLKWQLKETRNRKMAVKMAQKVMKIIMEQIKEDFKGREILAKVNQMEVRKKDAHCQFSIQQPKQMQLYNKKWMAQTNKIIPQKLSY